MPWYGREWSSTHRGIAPKHEVPSYEELAKRFPGLDQPTDAAQRQLFNTENGDNEDMQMDEADNGTAVEKKPVVSLSRRAPSVVRSRVGTRTSTPAPSAPGSPSLSPAASTNTMIDSDMITMQTPSRVSAAGATWKSPATKELSTPSRSLVISGNKSKTLRKSWNVKREMKELADDAKEKQQRLLAAQAEERREKARAIAQKAAYKKEQEMKNQQVQVISDTRKIKKMSRKQLRSITKMDVAMANKGNVVTSKILSRGTVPKGH